jgi:hypothetical protein
MLSLFVFEKIWRLVSLIPKLQPSQAYHVKDIHTFLATLYGLTANQYMLQSNVDVPLPKNCMRNKKCKIKKMNGYWSMYVCMYSQSHKCCGLGGHPGTMFFKK